MKTKKANKENSYLRNREILNDTIFIDALSNGHGYTTGKLSKILNLSWGTVHKHLNRLHERGLVNKTRHNKSFLWALHEDKEDRGCGYAV